MFTGNTKKVVVIKDIPSNMVEEAILILKTNVQVKENITVVNDKNKNHRSVQTLFKEAELIVGNYIKEIKKMDDINTLLKRNESSKKVSVNPKSKFFTNAIINSALALSVILLIFLVSKIY